MPRKSKNESIRCRYFRWILRRRGDVYWADGRGNRPAAGRHSLGTKDHEQALQLLEELDRVKAIEAGLADELDLERRAHKLMELHRGWDLYRAHLSRPEIVGGPSAKTRQRYKAVMDKFLQWSQRQGILYWDHVTAGVVTNYLQHLEKKGQSDRTQYLEGTVLKQIMKWLAQEELISRAALFNLPLRKVRGSKTYCWTKAEVRAMSDHCRKTPGLDWLADVITALAHTGMRISELAALRWSDVDIENNIIHISNDPPGGGRSARERRRTKNRRDRTVPLHRNLRVVLEDTKRSIDGRVFHGPCGGILKPDTVRTILIRDVIEPLTEQFPSAPGERGLEHGRVHGFRHYFCSVAANAGVPETVLMEWLGHQDSAMVRHYYHLHDAESQRQMAELDFAGDADRNGAIGKSPDSLETPSSGQGLREAS